MRFQEKTAAEEGFANVWAVHIAPGLGRYRSSFFRRRRFAVLGVIGFFGLIVPLLIWARRFVEPGSELAPVIYALSALGVSAGWYYLTCKGFVDHVRQFDQFMRASVAKHFAPIFRLETRPEQAHYYADMLQAEGMTRRGDATISNYHTGNYRDCSLEFFNVCYERVYYARNSGRRRSRSYFLIVAIGVPMAFNGEVHIKCDYGFVANWLRGKVMRKKRLQVSHHAFEEKFEIYADDPLTARRLVSRAFCNNLMAIEAMYPKRFGVLRRPMTALFKDGKFFLVIGNVSDMMSDGISYSHPDKVQKTARRMIARLAVMPRIVDYLHGRHG